ncbi:MAG: RNA degradosome polyphosphate kinase [Muribaculaceae bacterium]|nr:RNA degradosome polyphosphate kinase [Muribaculaceae bacterium]
MSDTHHNPFPYVNRDISWMYFNHRILKEAMRDTVPPLDRLSFLGIYSNNLDEFFRVRMATISRLATMSGSNVAHERHKARELFTELSDMDHQFTKEYEQAIHEVEQNLADNNILILNEKELNDEQRHFIRCLFREKISGFVSPVWINKLNEFSRENDDRIYMAVELSGPGMKTDYAIIELPVSTIGRFIPLPSSDGKQCVMYLDDVIRLSLPLTFPGMGYTDFNAYSFKFTKDAEMEIDNDLHVGPLEKIAKAVKSRKKGATLRVIYDEKMPQQLLSMLMKKLHLDKLDTVKPSGRYHNHKDFMSFPAMGRDDLKYPVWRPIVRPELKGSDSLLQEVAARDRFIHVPYHTFDYLVRLLQEAAVSKSVKSIKMTLYRVAKNSKIIEALINAARNGKKVTAVVELLARFDESSNIHWAKKMQDAGVNVVFGVEGLKVHSKIVLIGMKNGNDIAVVGTGNFHEGNAKVYTDYFLMTANPAITKDVAEVFSFIKRPYRPVKYKHLLVSPNSMREPFKELIDKEIHHARKGEKAFIHIKINHITDEEMVARLYEAAREGVEVKISVRGNCSLVTGTPDLKGNLNASGIIDRYLEHSRLFHFYAGGENKVFIGSADWMPRNLDNRVEVVTPILDEAIKEDVINTIEYALRDNVQARVVDGTGTTDMQKTDDPLPFRSQEELYKRYDEINRKASEEFESRKRNVEATEAAKESEVARDDEANENN